MKTDTREKVIPCPCQRQEKSPPPHYYLRNVHIPANTEDVSLRISLTF